MENLYDIAKSSFDTERTALIRAFDRITPESFNAAVNALSSADGIGASGCGHSGIVCAHFAHLMCCIELPARFISPAEAVHGATGFLKKSSVMLFVSRGGKTSELIPILDICKKKGTTVITVTENVNSPLALGADIVLPVDITRETDKYNSQGTTSFTVCSVLFDALQAALIEKTGYKNEQFAVIHPAGAVGERLNADKRGKN